MNSDIQNRLDLYTKVFEKVEDTLTNFTGTGNMQVPALVSAVAADLGWDDDTAKSLDPVIRDFLKNHSSWEVVRGAHGGVRKKGNKPEKSKKTVSQTLKEELRSKIEEKVKSPYPLDEDPDNGF